MRIYNSNLENTYALGMNEDDIIDTWYYNVENVLDWLIEEKNNEKLYEKCNSVNTLKDIEKVVKEINETYNQDIKFETKESKDFLKLKEIYEDKVVDSETLDYIWEKDYVLEVINCGNSGEYDGMTLYTVYAENGDEFEVHFEGEF